MNEHEHITGRDILRLDLMLAVPATILFVSMYLSSHDPDEVARRAQEHATLVALCGSDMSQCEEKTFYMPDFFGGGGVNPNPIVSYATFTPTPTVIP